MVVAIGAWRPEWRPLMVDAARAGATDRIRTLLAAGIPPDAGADGISALGTALANGHLDTADVLQTKGADLDWRALAGAAGSYLPEIRALVEEAVLTSPDAVRLLPSVAHRIELLEPVLWQVQAMPDAWPGADPFEGALTSCDACFDALVRAGARPGAALLADRVGRGDLVAVRRLLAAGAPADGDPGRRPLAAAASGEGTGPLMAALLAAGADPTLAGPHGPPLHVARETEAVRLLLAAGAPVDHAALAAAIL